MNGVSQRSLVAGFTVQKCNKKLVLPRWLLQKTEQTCHGHSCAFATVPPTTRSLMFSAWRDFDPQALLVIGTCAAVGTVVGVVVVVVVVDDVVATVTVTALTVWGMRVVMKLPAKSSVKAVDNPLRTITPMNICLWLFYLWSRFITMSLGFSFLNTFL